MNVLGEGKVDLIDYMGTDLDGGKCCKSFIQQRV